MALQENKSSVASQENGEEGQDGKGDNNGNRLVATILCLELRKRICHL